MKLSQTNSLAATINKYMFFYRSVAAPNFRDNPRLLIQIAVSLFLAYAVALYLLILTEI